MKLIPLRIREIFSKETKAVKEAANFSLPPIDPNDIAYQDPGYKSTSTPLQQGLQNVETPDTAYQDVAPEPYNPFKDLKIPEKPSPEVGEGGEPEPYLPFKDKLKPIPEKQPEVPEKPSTDYFEDEFKKQIEEEARKEPEEEFVVEVKNKWETPEEMFVPPTQGETPEAPLGVDTDKIPSHVYNKKVDASIGSIMYIHSLGYNMGMWELNETHDHIHPCSVRVSLGDGKDRGICEHNNGTSFDIEYLLEHAIAHKEAKRYHWPPATVWANSHPGCLCRIVFEKPADHTMIPDNAPGMPLNAPEEIINDFKLKVWQALPQTINIDATTYPPDYAYKQSAVINIIDRYKFAEVSDWMEFITPIKIKTTKMIENVIGIKHPIDAGDAGFQIEKNDRYALIYSSKYNSLYKVSLDSIEYLNIGPYEGEPTKGIFVSVGNDVAIIHRPMGDKAYAYFPKYRSMNVIEAPFELYS